MLTRLMKYRIRNIEPYQYKEALEEMYAEWKEFDAICNAEFLPAFEDTSDDSNNGNDNKNDNDNDNKSNDNNTPNNSLKNANANKSFRDKLKAMGEAIANLVSKIVGWFGEMFGKLNVKDDEFLKRLDRAKANNSNIQDVTVTTYLYKAPTINTSVTKIDQQFQQVSSALEAMFDAYDDAAGMEKASDDEIVGKMNFSSTALGKVLDNDKCDIKADYYKQLFGDCGMSNFEETTEAEGFVKQWEANARGKKMDKDKDNGLQLTSAEGKSWVESCENYLRGGIANTVGILKNGITHIQNAQKSTGAKISAAIRGEVRTQKANERMQNILNGYNKYLAFVAMFYKTAYKLAVEARDNYKLVLQAAYKFS